MSGFVIAIDGPAASGKGAIAHALADAYGLPILDTGLLYRAVGLSVVRAGENPDDAAVAARHARALDLGRLDDPARCAALRPARPPAALRCTRRFAKCCAPSSASSPPSRAGR